jgi:hypothetical protein
MATLLFKWWIIASVGYLLPGQRTILQPESSAMHPFYVSVTEINHNSKEKAIEISCKIFIDDMEAALKQNYQRPVDLANASHKEQNDKLITQYISSKLNINPDGKPARLNYIGYEKDSESVFCYFEIREVGNLKKLDVTNSILQDITDKQINIMHITVNGQRKSYKLDYPNKKASFTF